MVQLGLMAREVEQIKEKIDLVEFLKGYIDLKPAGRNLKALCPFHSEKTPSFVVSPERKMWRCFGACGEGGDIFKFLMKHENLEFYEALKVLAERAGVPLARLDPRQQREFGILYDINAAAKDFFKDELRKNKQVLSYLQERGLKDDTIKEFELGFSPGGEATILHLLNAGFQISDIVRAGLASKNDRGLYRDKFYRRVIFPIFSTVGKVVAFTGRIVPWAKVSEGVPKYLNSPETPIFNKSKVLYGFHSSKSDIAKQRAAFFVEGQMDFLMAWQSGVKNVVAVSGTGMTPYHLEKLRRSADTAVLSFDNDEAGLKAVERSLDIFGGFDFHVRVVDLGDFEDPADACKNQPDFLAGAVKRARPAFQHLFETYFSSLDVNDIPSKKRLVRHFLSKIKGVRSPTEQNIWIKELAKVSGVPEVALVSEFETVTVRPSGAAGESRAVQAPQFQTVRMARRVGGEDREDSSRIDVISKRLVFLAFAEERFLGRLREKREWVPEFYCRIIDDPECESAGDLRMRASYEFGDADPGVLEEEFNDLLRNLRVEFLKRRRALLRARVGSVQDSEGEKLSGVLGEFYSVSKELDGLQ